MAAAETTGLIMTKLDGTARGGGLVAIAQKLALPIYFIGVGEQADDLQSFGADNFARALVGLEDERHNMAKFLEDFGPLLVFFILNARGAEWLGRHGKRQPADCDSRFSWQRWRLRSSSLMGASSPII